MFLTALLCPPRGATNGCWCVALSAHTAAMTTIDFIGIPYSSSSSRDLEMFSTYVLIDKTVRCQNTDAR